MSHFFIAGAFARTNFPESAELQLARGIWGLCTSLIRDNLQKFLTPESHGLVYVLKEGIRAGIFDCLAGPAVSGVGRTAER